MLGAAIVIITFAMIFYTIGVWAERAQKILKWWHAAAFGLGLSCDAIGTYLMSKIADQRSGATTSGFNQVMVVSGGLALALMTVHLGWAVVVLLRNRTTEKAIFHKFSLVVWSIWLVPYITGAVGAM